MMFVDAFYDQLMLSIEIERDWIKNSLKLVWIVQNEYWLTVCNIFECRFAHNIYLLTI